MSSAKEPLSKTMSAPEYQEGPARAKMAQPIKPVLDLTYSYMDSIKFYFNWKSPEFYESKLLSYLPFFPEPTETKSAEIINTPINGKGHYIHEFCVKNKLPPSEGKEPIDIVLVHGYGAALGFFYKNFDGLSSIPGSTLHAIDMNGFGLSSRPKFPNYKTNSIEEIYKTEGFFIDSFEEWRKKKGLNHFVMIGHSLGGYLSSCYYMKYGDNVVDKLVLVSPVGVEDNEYSLYNENPKLPGQNVESSGSKWLIKAWEKHYSPFSILRAISPLSTKLVSRWAFTKFGSDNEEEMMDVLRYTTRIFLAKGSGEYGLTRILAPGAIARLPLIKRIPDKMKVPSLWVYGDGDWMNKYAGYDACKKINKLNNDADSTKASFGVISDGGHHMYFDNVSEFNEKVLKFIQK